MSLVAYGSSDDSDSETQTSIPENRTTTGALFSSLPAPKHPGATVGSNHGSAKVLRVSTAKEATAKDDTAPAQYRGGLFTSLPKPKKRTEPVKITVPELGKRGVSLKAYGFCDYQWVVRNNASFFLFTVRFWWWRTNKEKNTNSGNET